MGVGRGIGWRGWTEGVGRRIGRGVGLRGSDGDRTGGIGLWIGLEGSDWGVGLEVGLRGSNRRGRTGGVRRGVEQGRTEAFHFQKKRKHFSFRNYTKVLLNLVNFSLPLRCPRGDVNTKMAFSNT